MTSREDRRGRIAALTAVVAALAAPGLAEAGYGASPSGRPSPSRRTGLDTSTPRSGSTFWSISTRAKAEQLGKLSIDITRRTAPRGYWDAGHCRDGGKWDLLPGTVNLR